MYMYTYCMLFFAYVCIVCVWYVCVMHILGLSSLAWALLLSGAWGFIAAQQAR